MVTSFDILEEQKAKYAYLNDPAWWAEQLERGLKQYRESEAYKQRHEERLDQLVNDAILAISKVVIVAYESGMQEAAMFPTNAARKRLPKPYNWKGETLDTPLYHPMFGKGGEGEEE